MSATDSPHAATETARSSMWAKPLTAVARRRIYLVAAAFVVLTTLVSWALTRSPAAFTSLGAAVLFLVMAGQAHRETRRTSVGHD